MRRIERPCGHTSRGWVTSQCEYLLTNYQVNTEKVVALSQEGNIKYCIPLLNQYSSFDVTCIDENTVVVTTGKSVDKTGIIILDFNTRVEKRFVSSEPYGINFDGKSFICCCDEMAIHVISCEDFSIRIIANTVMHESSYITTQAYKILYTNPDENEVNCCLYSGELVWKFKNESRLKNSREITVDDKGNVFVVGLETINILVIASDAKRYKEIDTTHYGLPKPRTIFF